MNQSDSKQGPKILHNATAAMAITARAEYQAVELCAPVRRILTLHSGSLRELLFCLPALKTLRETFEGAHIGAVVRSGLAPLLESSGLLDEVFVRPEGGLSSQATLMAKLHAHKSDMAIAFSASRKSTLLAWSSGAPIRIGFADARMEALFTHRVEKDGARPLDIEACLDLARAVGCAPRCYDYCEILQVAPHLLVEADSLLREYSLHGPFLVIAAQSETRISREEQTRVGLQWKAVCLSLASRWPLVFIGAKPNRNLLQATRQAVPNGAFCDLGGQLDPINLAALCARSKLFVGHAGGNSHLAAAMNIPVVAICPAKAEREVHEPRGVSHRVLESDCAPEMIVQAVKEMIGVKF